MAVFLIAVLDAPAGEKTPPVTDATILETIATCQEFDSRIPWRKKPPHIRQALGVVIEGNYILTVESIARNSTLIEIRRAKTGTKLEAKAIVSDEQVGIALLKIIDDNAVSRLKSVPIADQVKRNDLVTIVKLDKSGQLQSDEGQVIEVTSSPRGLLFKVLTDLSIEKNGTPVFIGNKLAGITVRYDKSTQTCTALSGTTLKQIVSAAMTPPYRGIAWAGLIWEPLLDPVKREHLGISEQKGGILVVRTAPGSGAATVLQTEDVIIEIDGYKIDEMGYYTDPDFGRLLFSHIINGRHMPGENASLIIIRNRQKITVKLPLKRQSDVAQLIPGNKSGAQNEYLADGGMILRELTADYLRAAGSKWILQINPRLVNYYFNPWQFSTKESEHIVILSMVLPDQINIGYHEYRDEVVTAVNGENIHRLDDVFRVVDRDGGLKRFTLMGNGVDLVLDEKEMPAANKRIAANYRIPSLRHQRSQSNDK